MTAEEVEKWLDLLTPDGEKFHTKLQILEDLQKHANSDGMSPEDRAIVAACVRKLRVEAEVWPDRDPYITRPKQAPKPDESVDMDDDEVPA